MSAHKVFSKTIKNLTLSYKANRIENVEVLTVTGTVQVETVTGTVQVQTVLL